VLHIRWTLRAETIIICVCWFYFKTFVYLNSRYDSALQNSFQILPETIWHFPLCVFSIYTIAAVCIILYIYIKVYSHNCVRTVYRSQLNCQHCAYILSRFYTQILLSYFTNHREGNWIFSFRFVAVHIYI